VSPEDLVRLLIQRLFRLETKVQMMEDTLIRIQRERGAR